MALHIQATLSQGIRELMKSPWQRSLHMYESIYDTNPLFMKASFAKVYGISAWNAFEYYKMTTDCVSLNNTDRQRLLKQQLRILMNMLPIDFAELILEEEDIDIFNPIEQMNGQCLCDFYLVKSQHVAERIKIQKTQNTREGLARVFFKKQPNDDLKTTLENYGLL